MSTIVRKRFESTEASLPGTRTTVRPTGGSSANPIVVPDRLSPTGILFRITEVDPKANNRAEGAVKPGATPFWQTVHGGTWSQLVTSGSGLVNIAGRSQRVKAGDRITIPAETPFALLNDSTQIWTYQLINPSWGTTRFSYQVGSQALAGDEIWFRMRATPEDERVGGPTFRLAAAGGASGGGTIGAASGGGAIGDFVVDPTLCFAVLGAGDQTAGQQSTSGSEFVTVVEGDVSIGIRGTQAHVQAVDAGQSIEIPSGTVYFLANQGDRPGMFMIEPNPPRVWTPETILWDMGDGNLLTGDRIWFELVFPF